MNFDGLISQPTFRPNGRLDALFSGGGQKPPKPPKQEPIKFPKMPEIHIPPVPASVPTPPPPTATSADVAQAEEQTRRDMNKRKGLRKTVLAGETGGYGKLGGGTILGGQTGQ